MSIDKQTFLDKLSIGASVLCALHCAFLPIALAVFPVLSFLPSSDHTFHMALVVLIVPLSLAAAFIGCKKHRDMTVMIGIITGIITLVMAAVFGHDLLGEAGEKIITVVATAILAYSHWRNYSLCRRKSCNH
ncbi:hypothetical protein tloyanaT_30860 [Thalassotalea loyana]|uniref:MerC domain-containing protein n=1 Tax=Thalassotalea loyana TaxID=280483 RepID=A0ABQ6HFG7_9GAMM|nr:MerC domain-containing protein [Thalassotalea loyana]GLX86833.1 hypothetical protein tloyanaT_30860 [Thalassotalea loyana]